MYNPRDWYWIVDNDEVNVWTSLSLTYVLQSSQGYSDWSAIDNNFTSRIASQSDLAQVMSEQVIPGILTDGLQIISTGSPGVSAVYRLDEITIADISSLAAGAANDALGFPNNASTFDYPDINGVPHTFTKTNMVDFYKAMRDYIANLKMAVSARVFEEVVGLPTQPVTIP